MNTLSPSTNGTSSSFDVSGALRGLTDMGYVCSTQPNFREKFVNYSENNISGVQYNIAQTIEEPASFSNVNNPSSVDYVDGLNIMNKMNNNLSMPMIPNAATPAQLNVLSPSAKIDNFINHIEPYENYNGKKLHSRW